jgi:hypothetical protein
MAVVLSYGIFMIAKPKSIYMDFETCGKRNKKERQTNIRLPLPYEKHVMIRGQ